MPKVSASIICRDEEANIGECLKSVSWCDEIVVVDSGSTDKTVEIAKQYTKHVLHNDWPGYVEQKNFALDKTTGDWILCLDADERCTPELRDEIQQALRADETAAGFEVKRHVWYLGRWINHGGWYPDWKLRLVRRGKARWGGVDPHDKLIPDGHTRRLEAELVHYTYGSFRDHIRTLNRFSDVMSDELVKKEAKSSLLKALFHPVGKFFECYLWKGGFYDGWPGFVIAAASAFHVFARHVKLWEKTEKPAAAPTPKDS